MKQKIEWYREVLELEPGSRVFFPLAKLLAADGQTAEAVNALHQGLLRHPDHIEARLLLAELLYLQNDEAGLYREIENLGGIFSLYPGFWKAWSETLAGTPAFHDAALAMRFFSAALQGKAVSWAGVIEQGLQAMLGETVVPSTGPSPHMQTLKGLAVTNKPATTFSISEDFSVRPTMNTDEADLFSDDESIGRQEGMDDDDAEETFSIRTRSMAEVLAEQGDIAGALDIYHELVQNVSDEEKNSLEARIAELATRMDTPVPTESKTEENVTAPGEESKRLVSLLESLAQRLEDRAR